MKARLLGVVCACVLCAGLLAACSERIAGGPAGQCAEVVRIYRDLQSSVAVVGQPVEASNGGGQIEIEIQYEGMDAMNLPVKGSAMCSFTVGSGGTSTLLEATVEGYSLDESEIAVIRNKMEK